LIKLVTVSALREQFSLNDKLKEANLSSAELNNLNDKWEQMELNNFIRELRPNSYREGKKAFDDCVKKGKNTRMRISNFN